MYITEATYSLTLFEPSRQDRSALSEALSLYSKNTPPHERTATNEIMYWFERYNSLFEDRLFLLGFYRNGQTIGFAEAAWFAQERLVILDYLSVGEDYERNNTIFEFLSQFFYFLDAQPIEHDYILTEINYSWLDGKPDKDNELWIDLLRFQGFGLVQAAYQIPRLGGANYESSSPGGLMVFRKHGIRTIRKETYLMFVETILTKHYLRWYTPFLGNQLPDYHNSLQRIRNEITAAVADESFFTVNGTSPILSTSATTPQRGMNRGINLKNFTGTVTLLLVVSLALAAAGLNTSSMVAVLSGSIFTLLAVYILSRPWGPR